MPAAIAPAARCRVGHRRSASCAAAAASRRRARRRHPSRTPFDGSIDRSSICRAARVCSWRGMRIIGSGITAPSTSSRTSTALSLPSIWRSSRSSPCCRSRRRCSEPSSCDSSVAGLLLRESACACARADGLLVLRRPLRRAEAGARPRVATPLHVRPGSARHGFCRSAGDDRGRAESRDERLRDPDQGPALMSRYPSIGRPPGLASWRLASNQSWSLWP